MFEAIKKFDPEIYQYILDEKERALYSQLTKQLSQGKILKNRV